MIGIMIAQHIFGIEFGLEMGFGMAILIGIVAQDGQEHTSTLKLPVASRVHGLHVLILPRILLLKHPCI